MYYKNIDKDNPAQYGQIINFSETTKLYNVYGLFFEDDGCTREVGEEDYFADEEGNIYNGQIFAGSANHTLQERGKQFFIKSSDGSYEAVNPDYSEHTMKVYIHHNGHNYEGIVLEDSIETVSWEAMPDFDPDEFETLYCPQYTQGVRTQVLFDPKTNIFYCYEETLWVGSFNYYEEAVTEIDDRSQHGPLAPHLTNILKQLYSEYGFFTEIQIRNAIGEDSNNQVSIYHINDYLFTYDLKTSEVI